MSIAEFVEEITVIDPDTKGEVKMEIYKHEGGGMLAIDSSFIYQVLGQLDEAESAMIMDPFEAHNPNTTIFGGLILK